MIKPLLRTLLYPIRNVGSGSRWHTWLWAVPIPPLGYGWVVYDKEHKPVRAYNCTEQDLYPEKPEE